MAGWDGRVNNGPLSRKVIEPDWIRARVFARASRDPLAQAAVAQMSVFVRPHDKQGANETANSESRPSVVTAATACCIVSPV